jgi:hypothetical protein
MMLPSGISTLSVGFQTSGRVKRGAWARSGVGVGVVVGDVDVDVGAERARVGRRRRK